jgi:hypothetical protein
MKYEPPKIFDIIDEYDQALGGCATGRAPTGFCRYGRGLWTPVCRAGNRPGVLCRAGNSPRIVLCFLGGALR